LPKFTLAAGYCLLFLFKISLRFLNQILTKMQNLKKIYAALERLLQKANLNLTVFSTKKN